MSSERGVRRNSDASTSTWHQALRCGRRRTAKVVEAGAAGRRKAEPAATPAPDDEASSSVQWLLRTAGSAALLTGEQERALACRIRQGDHSARERLTNANLRLVVCIARRYSGSGLPLPDLVQEGIVGLMRAVEKFDDRKGTRFSTYATFWIRQSIHRAILEQKRLVRLPVHAAEALQKLNKTAAVLSQDMGRAPSVAEIAARARVALPRAQELLASGVEPVSLDALIEGEEDLRIGDVVPGSAQDRPAAALDRMIQQEEIEVLLSILSPREREVLGLRYGLSGGEPKTLDEIGQRLHVSRERVRQIECRAMAKLRQRAGA